MLAPTEFDLSQLVHVYDPAKAHEYYLRTRKLKGRPKGQSVDPRTGKTREKISEDAKAKQRKELAARIQSLSKKLQRLEARIREMEHKEAREDRKSKAKKERAAKEREKPKTAAEKAEAAREAKKYRKKHQQQLKTKAKKASDKSGGGSSSGETKKSKASVSDLKALATKVRGQIAVAKQKLAAL
jgi:hypothetical protein